MMRRVLCFSVFAILMAAFCSQTLASGIPWRKDLRAAQAEAAQTGRLVLVHFWAPWCKPCMKLEHTVFNKPEVASAITAAYVPVKLNADEHKAIANSFNITKIPQDIILYPNGRIIKKTSSPRDAQSYIAAMTNISRMVAQRDQQNRARATVASQPLHAAAPQVTTVNPVSNTVTNPAYSSVQPYNSATINANNPPRVATHQTTYQPAPQVSYQPAVNNTTAASQPQTSYTQVSNTVSQQPITNQQPVVAQQPTAPEKQQFGMDGFCPVTLRDAPLAANDAGRWVKGKAEWGAVHRGRTYLFVGKKEQELFLQAPDVYAPALGGMDPMIAFGEGKMVDGLREHGIWHDGLVYLFASEESLQAFLQNPNHYAQNVRQAMNTNKPTTTR